MIHQPTNIARGKTNLLPYLPIASREIGEVNFFGASIPLLFTLIDKATAITSPSTEEFQTLGRNLHAIQTAVENGDTFGGTVLVEATLDGSHWFTLDTITTATIKQYSGVFSDIRVSITAYTSGHISVFAATQRA